MEDQAHRPTSRVLDILERLASTEDGLTLTEIAAQVGAPKSSLFPFVHTLLQRRYLELDKATGKYTIGLHAFALSASYLETHSLYRMITAEMRNVVDECSEVCQLGVLEGGDVLYIGKVDSPEAIRLVSHVGKRLPANCTAIGKALLSQHTEQEIRALYTRGLPSLADASVTDFQELLRQVNAVNDLGYAMDIGESHEHIRCYAVPLFFQGNVDAAMSVSTPLFRHTEEKGALIRESLFRAQKRIQTIMEDMGVALSARNG